ncbi:MAG: S8 family serine peptidase [Bacteroidales bacterium]|nr:S8 family serine peptidase [Bacteroidales bacterium]
MKKILYSVLFLMVVCALQAQTTKLSGAAQLLVSKHASATGGRQRVKGIDAAQEASVLTTILLEEGSQMDADKLKALGIEVDKQCGSLVFADVPICSLEALGQMEGIRLADTGRPVKPCLDLARQATSVALVQNTGSAQSALPHPYTGKGVLVAIIDSEIDPGHPVFRDAEGKLRIKEYGVFGYDKDTKKNTRTIYGEGEMDKAIAFNANRSLHSIGHGTHVGSIAAGSTACLPDSDPMKAFGGMAPEADLLLYDIDLSSENNILYALAQAYEKADELQQPIVVNMSIGATKACLDGTDSFSILMKTLIDSFNHEGKILCICSGNEGNGPSSAQLDCNKPIVNNTWTEQETFYYRGADSPNIINGVVYHGLEEGFTFYSSDTRDFAVQYTIREPDGTLIKTFDPIVYDGKLGAQVKHFAGTANGDAYDVTFETTTEMTGANRFYMLTDVYANVEHHFDLYATILTRESDMHIDVAVQNGRLMEGNGCHGGNSYGSINYMACNDGVISVGSYDSRHSFTDINGYEVIASSSVQGDISYYSGYRTLHYGTPLPHVLGPGSQIIAAMHHNMEKTSMGVFGTSNYDGVEYLWAGLEGTSMSTPAVSGIVALWLQANPRLDREAVCQILSATSDYDEFCKAMPERSGYGKVNALRGLQYIHTTGIEEVESDRINRPAKYVDGNGRIILQRDGKVYNVMGVRMR